jgi:hypothetical protein
MLANLHHFKFTGGVLADLVGFTDGNVVVGHLSAVESGPGDRSGWLLISGRTPSFGYKLMKTVVCT